MSGCGYIMRLVSGIFIFLVLSMLMCSSASATYDVNYEANDTPAAEGFYNYTDVGNYSESVADGLYNLSSDETAARLIWRTTGTFEINESGYNLFFRINLEDVSPNQFSVTVYDGSYIELIDIRDSLVDMSYVDVAANSSATTTDGWHTYLLRREGTNVKLYQDDVLLMNGTSDTSTSYNRLDFGDRSSTYYSNFSLDYIRVESDIPTGEEEPPSSDWEMGNYYVSPDGDNSNNGTYDYPFETLAYVAPNLTAGSTLYLKAGNYPEKRLTFAQSGNTTHPITITTLEGVTLDGSSVPDYDPGYAVMRFDGDYWNIANISITNWNTSYGILIDEANHISMDNISVQGICVNTDTHESYGIGNGYAVYMMGNNISLTNSITSDTSWNQIQIATTRLATESNTSDIRIDNCNIGHTTDHGIIDLLNGQYNDSKFLRDIIITNCTIHDSPYGAIFPHGAWPYRMENITIRDNVFSDAAYVDIEYFTNSTITNNTFSGMSNYGFGAGSSVGFGNNMVIADNNITDDKDFYIFIREGLVGNMYNQSAAYHQFGSKNITSAYGSPEQYPPTPGHINLIDPERIQRVQTKWNVTYDVQTTDGELYNVTLGDYTTLTGITSNSSGTFYELSNNGGDNSYDYYSSTGYSFMPTTSANITNVSDNGCSVALTTAENVTFTEFATGNTTSVELMSGETYVEFSELDFASGETVLPLSIQSSTPSGTTISITNTTTLQTLITVNKQVNISTYLNGNLMQTDTLVTTSTYTNSSMEVGSYNLTMLASVDGESVNRVWTVEVSAELDSALVGWTAAAENVPVIYKQIFVTLAGATSLTGIFLVYLGITNGFTRYENYWIPYMMWCFLFIIIMMIVYSVSVIIDTSLYN